MSKLPLLVVALLAFGAAEYSIAGQPPVIDHQAPRAAANLTQPDPTVTGLNSPNDGYFSFGAQCNGTDCPAAHYHVVFNGTTLAASGICMRVLAGVYLMDGYGVWKRWSPGAGQFVTSSAPPGGRCNNLPYSANGSTLSTPGTGSLTTAVGTWSLGAACSGSYATLLNGTQTGNGCGKQLLISQDGKVFTQDAGNGWWAWSSAAGGTWTNLNTTTRP
jgi:hypothetical protein